MTPSPSKDGVISTLTPAPTAQEADEMMYLGTETTFDAAHFLPGYEGKCSQMHGHTYRVKVEIGGVPVLHDGILIDFHLLSEALEREVRPFDHRLLNDVFLEIAYLKQQKFPTAEVLADYLRDMLWGQFRQALTECAVSVTVYETPTHYARSTRRTAHYEDQ